MRRVLELTVALEAAALGLCCIAAIGLALMIWEKPKCLKP
jgi:hypothetical protein